MFEFNKESHEYKLNGVSIPSVTQIIKTAGLSDLSYIDKDLLNYKAQVGDAIHLATQYYDNNELDLDSVSDLIKPRFNSYLKFKEDYKPETIGIELQLYHKLYLFAGTIDRIFLIDNKLTLLDIKSGVKEKHHAIQTAGYELLYNQGKKQKEQIKQRMILYLSDNGYKIETNNNKNDKNVFLSALTITNYLRGVK